MLELLAQHESGGWQQTVDSLARTPLSQITVLVVICTVLRFLIAPKLASTPPHLRFGLFKGLRFFNEFLDAIIYAGVFVFLVIRPFALQTFVIPTGSMLETLQLNDFIVANKAIYRYSTPKVGDIVVFRPPVYACMPSQLTPTGEVNADFIKRCVGVGGDIVELRDGTLYRNGSAVSEPYVTHRATWDFKLVDVSGVLPKSDHRYWPLALEGDRVNANPNITAEPFRVSDALLENKLRELPAASIPKGYYLFMGDNRSGSFDGRAWGLIPEHEVIGRAEFIWLPISRIQRLR